MTKQVRQALGLLCVAGLALIAALAVGGVSGDLQAIGLFVAVIAGGLALVTLAIELLRD